MSKSKPVFFLVFCIDLLHNNFNEAGLYFKKVYFDTPYWAWHKHSNISSHWNIASTPMHGINTRRLRQQPHIASTLEHWITIRTLHQHMNIASTPKHWINTHTCYWYPTLHKHRKYAYTWIFHQHLNITWT